ncbi:DUF3347 domain-containing protein [Maribacter sp. BPC-D8]|uniref:DUF3347 domain-containing protein n=1 Tax=Maribacter sp. BPC-D8 TaxID=3053613 RepID=UPI002B4654C1|nr:DUF3347 domain-containing protein [Maribacter sp. BPC-D8]WRI28360.1 DUF3347 domain-containing protein [Maribacter sp. BPC-D8]
MKSVNKSIATIALTTMMIVTISCKDEKKGNEVSSEEIEMNDAKKMSMSASEKVKVETILSDYFNLKDALVDDDNDKAKTLGNTLAKSLGSLDQSKYSENKLEKLAGIIADATVQSKHISETDIVKQREHFKILSKDLTNMVAFTGTENTLYQQFCPMYDGGSAWLSKSNNIKNPYYGSKMLTCGKVQKEIN